MTKNLEKNPDEAYQELLMHANGNEPAHKRWNLVTIKDIKAGEELTLRYTFYNV